jgi:type II secretion system protein N
MTVHRVTRTRLVTALGASALFVAVLAWTFPLETVLRHALVRAARPGWPEIVFARASLRPTGIVLREVSLRAPDGAPLVHAERVALRPSLLGLLRGARGLPWHVTAVACRGALDGSVRREGAGLGVTLGWQDADLAACPPLVIAGGALAGLATGAARFALAPGAVSGAGSVEVRAATWRATDGPFAGAGALRADRAQVEWTLDEGRLHLTTLALHGPDVDAAGRGEVRLVAPVEASDLDLDLALMPVGGGRGPVRLYLAFLPPITPGGSERRLTVGGTLARPELRAP